MTELHSIKALLLIRFLPDLWFGVRWLVLYLFVFWPVECPNWLLAKKKAVNIVFFFLSGISFTDHLLFYSTTSTPPHEHSDIYLKLCRWDYYPIFLTATRWDLPPYWIIIWLIDMILIFVCLLVDLILGFVTAILHEKSVDLNSHQLSSLYYKQTD